MSVRRTQQEVDSHEFAEWLAFDEIEPGFPVRQDFHAATIAHAIYSMLRGPKSPSLRVQDFLLRFQRRENVESELIPEKSITERDKLEARKRVQSSLHAWLTKFRAAGGKVKRVT